MSAKPIHADIVGHWKTRAVSINGKRVTVEGFVRDLKADEQEPGDNQDIIRECIGVRRFRWGGANQATYCLALACCFYLNVKWVMDRFFEQELERVPQGDLHIVYDNAQLEQAYQRCEENFAQEFNQVMKQYGAIEVEE
jgi:hypothetical protein